MNAAVLRMAVIGLVLVAAAPGHGQVGGPASAIKSPAKLEPVAETKLLMDGLAHNNFRGLERILSEKPTATQAWVYGRGQAILLAETANLLMLRPPRNQGQALWFDRAADLRKHATQLARTLAKRDYEGSRTGLRQVAGTCNRCHHTFRVDAEIVPFAMPVPKAE